MLSSYIAYIALAPARHSSHSLRIAFFLFSVISRRCIKYSELTLRFCKWLCSPKPMPYPHGIRYPESRTCGIVACLVSRLRRHLRSIDSNSALCGRLLVVLVVWGIVCFQSPRHQPWRPNLTSKSKPTLSQVRSLRLLKQVSPTPAQSPLYEWRDDKVLFGWREWRK